MSSIDELNGGRSEEQMANLEAKWIRRTVEKLRASARAGAQTSQLMLDAALIIEGLKCEIDAVNDGGKSG
jgi:hypothetical protein